jgi:hypothetical protein
MMFADSNANTLTVIGGPHDLGSAEVGDLDVHVLVEQNVLGLEVAAGSEPPQMNAGLSNRCITPLLCINSSASTISAA